MAIYLSSDLHIGHDREFIWKVRGFSSIEDMNESIIENFNSIVKPDDELYLLGDLCLGPDLENNREYLSRLNGRLHLVYGNHDTERRKQMYQELPNFVEATHAMAIKYRKYHFYLSHYPTLVGNFEERRKLYCLCGHLHTDNKFLQMSDCIYHVDPEAHNCYPISIDDVIEDIKIFG